MSDNIFSVDYTLYCDDLKNALNDYETDSSEDNKNKLKALKSQVWSDEKRFTLEYLAEYVESQKERTLTFEEEFNWLMRSIKIDDKALNGTINEIDRAYLHSRNDASRDKLKRLTNK